MLMYVSTADGYKYRSLMRVYRRTSKIESIFHSLIDQVPLLYPLSPTSSVRPPTRTARQQKSVLDLHAEGVKNCASLMAIGGVSLAFFRGGLLWIILS